VLIGQLGVRMVLLVGGTVPLPASHDVMRAISRVQVTSDADGEDGFQITMRVGRDGPTDFGLVGGGTFGPMNRVVVGVLFGAVPEVLIDGVVTHTQLTPGRQAGETTFTVTGTGLSKLLDLEEKNDEFPNQPDFVIAGSVLASYARYGLVPALTPTTDVPLMIQRIPRQAETDLAFLRRMAGRNGYVFYIEPVTLGVSTAYWGPETRLSLPQPALTTNMGAHDNLKGIHFSNDATAQVGTEGAFLEPMSGTVIPLPSLPPLKVPPLTMSPAPTLRKAISRDAAKANPMQAGLLAIADATRAPDAVTAQGEVDSARYGHALRTRKLVGVRGVGFSYGGMYYVRKVTHTLGPGEYSQQFTLSREGTGSLTPVVRP
jgi:hypothetical protein